METHDQHFRLILNRPDAGVAQADFKLQTTHAITVEAWVNIRTARAEAMQTIVAQWQPLAGFDTFDACDAGRTSGLDTTGFFGAVFDGRYVYFVPQHDTQTRHGKVLRYDTHGEFKDPASWQTYDAGNTDGLNTKGYYGAVFDGRYVFFVPRRDADDFHSRVLRCDTRGRFTDKSSWSAYDLGVSRSHQSAAFDGRYIYFAPGHASIPKDSVKEPPKCASPAVTGMNPDSFLIGNSIVVRHDTRGEFKDPKSWVMHDAADTDGLDASDYDGALFDGRYIYFAPLSTGIVLCYDTRGEFTDKRSWSACNIKPLGMKLCVGAVFDGRHVYFVPYGETATVIRYDTAAAFNNPKSWSSYEFSKTAGMTTRGFDGGMFDGRYVYFVPYFDGKGFFHGVMLRYDTQSEFANPRSWAAHDAGLVDGLKTVGFNAGAFDGRHLYCAPWNDGSAYPRAIIGNGRVLRYDTLGSNGSFSLRFCDYGHNGGLCAALPGARFLVNTDQGARSVAANRPPEPGRHYLAGTYDGRFIRLFLEGALVNEQSAAGRMVGSQAPLSIGRVDGCIEQIRISDCARSADWIAGQSGCF
ncbi:MAG: LamG domain-containing protein [Verrucomicrobia bacterium]|nr:LamG domain-containing protein [Verrucomicrobiota bacterium]